MKIDRNNYEIFLLDYMDGTLSEADRRKVEQFLANNLDLAEELSHAKELESDSFDYSSQERASLYRSFSDVEKITEENLEEFCVAYLEDDLAETEKKKLESYLKAHPQYQKMLELHRAMHLQADPQVQFPNKSQLKRRAIVPMRRYAYLSGTVAAAVIVGFLLYFISTDDKNSNTPASMLAEAKELATPIQNAIPNTTQPTIETQPPLTQTKKMLAVLDTTSEESPGTILLSVLDTTHEASPGTVQLAKLNSRDIKPLIYSEEREHAIPLSRNIKPAPVIANYQHPHANSSPSEANSRMINRETLLMSALKAGLKGYNSLTESDLALNTEQNRKGKITGIRINSENFQLERKFKPNNKN